MLLHSNAFKVGFDKCRYVMLWLSNYYKPAVKLYNLHTRGGSTAISIISCILRVGSTERKLFYLHHEYSIDNLIHWRDL